MSFVLKDLDDRSFQSLVDEAKRRIVAYLPEWTDHNESDPGITLVQLFAWLTETAIFRLNRVPDERMYLSFLDLLGFAPAPARSAQAILALSVRPGAAPNRYAPYELKFAAGETFFEPDAAVPTIGAALGLVLVDDRVDTSRRDVTAQNEVGEEPYAPFGLTGIGGRALYLGLDTTPAAGVTPPPLVPGGTSAELQLYVRADEEAKPLDPSCTCFGDVVASIESDLKWEALGEDDTWIPLQVVLDETRGLRRSGLLRLKVTDAVRPAVEPDDPGKRPRFWIRAVAGASTAPETRSIHYVVINAVRVRQWTTYAGELLVPGSDGTPRQQRKVRHPPILADDLLALEVNEPDEHGDLRWIRWTLAKDASGLATRAPSGAAQAGDRPLRVFRLLPDHSGIELGDGLDGLIPPRGANNLRITYRSGGGKAGNVAAGQIALAVSKPDITGVRQIEAATGGRDEEAVQDAIKMAPRRVRAIERAVTAEDFETLAVQFAGVARATALNRYHPLYPDVPVTGAVTLVVVPYPAGEDPAPTPDQPFLDEVAKALEPYRVLTTELFLVAPRYRDVAVAVEIRVRREADAADARASVARVIAAFFDPIRGGRDGEGWPLGGTIVHGELLSAVLGAGSVAAVTSLTITVDGELMPPCADVPLTPEGGRSIDLVRAAPAAIRVAAPSQQRR
jgi:hypothetical protein